MQESVKLNIRRKGALERLLAQLQSGKKRVKNKEVPLTDVDKARIEGELKTLRSRVTL